MMAKANRAAEDKDKENNEILGKLNAVLEGQAASKTQIDELNETIKTLNDTVKKLKKELGKKDRLIADLQDRLSRINFDLFGSKSQKGGTTGKAADRKSKEQDKDDFDGTPGSAVGVPEPEKPPVLRVRQNGNRRIRLPHGGLDMQNAEGPGTGLSQNFLPQICEG